MANITGTLNYNTQTQTAELDFGDTPTPLTLDYGNTLTLSVGTGFPNQDSIQISECGFWDSVGGGKGSNSKGTWKRDGSGSVPVGLAIEADGSGVKFTDNDTTENEDYYFNVKAIDTTDRTKSYPADPELVVKKGTLKT